MRQTKLLKLALVLTPLYLTACQGVEGMFEHDGGYHSGSQRAAYDRHSNMKNATVLQETSAQSQTPVSTARSRTEAAAEAKVEVVPAAKKSPGPAVPVQAPSVNGM